MSWGPSGLVPAVVQDVADGRVLMVAYVDAEALAATLATGEVHFHSRSRDRLWRKGETSGNVLRLVDIDLDCDGDALLIQVEPAGPTCHRGTRSCFDPATTVRPPPRRLQHDRGHHRPGLRLARDAVGHDRLPAPLPTRPPPTRPAFWRPAWTARPQGRRRGDRGADGRQGRRGGRGRSRATPRATPSPARSPTCSTTPWCCCASAACRRARSIARLRERHQAAEPGRRARPAQALQPPDPQRSSCPSAAPGSGRRSAPARRPRGALTRSSLIDSPPWEMARRASPLEAYRPLAIASRRAPPARSSAVNSKWSIVVEEACQHVRVADRLLGEGRLADPHGPSWLRRRRERGPSGRRPRPSGRRASPDGRPCRASRSSILARSKSVKVRRYLPTSRSSASSQYW